MFWECLPVACFWRRISGQLSDILSVPISVTVTTLLLNDLSQLPNPRYQKRLTLAGVTAAKELIAMRWKHPDNLSVINWILTFLHIIYLEEESRELVTRSY